VQNEYSASDNVKDNDNNYLKLHVGDVVRVHAKDTSMKDDGLWYGECSDIYGYFPKNVVKETEIYTFNLIYVVPSKVGSISTIFN
jgi:hypothetical protein